ncbi:MAG: peptidylprolyl isomerase [Candidatus Dormibacteria bacterium]
MSESSPDPRRRLFVFGLTAVVIAAVVIAGIAINRSNNSNMPAASPPVGVASPTPSGPPQTSFADCTTVQFGAPLPPLNPPADVHRYSAAPSPQTDDKKLYQATITTDKGAIVLCLQPNLAPNTVNNFVALARNHFYDGLVFHRVEPDFVIQGGDPQGTGNGGPGYQCGDEPVRQQYVDGAVAMANSGSNTNGSQFFIDIADNTLKLQPSYNLFGKVQSGLDVAHRIAKGDVMRTVTVAQQQ